MNSLKFTVKNLFIVTIFHFLHNKFNYSIILVFVYLVLVFLLPFAPLDPSRGTVGTIPLKSREFVQFLRDKLGVPA